VPASTSQTVDPLAVVRTGTASDNPQADEAPFPVTAVMLVDAALPRPGRCWRASVLTGLAEEIGFGVDQPTRARPLEPCFSGQAAWASGVTWHVAAKKASGGICARVSHVLGSTFSAR
jgi:hypothetical protein